VIDASFQTSDIAKVRRLVDCARELASDASVEISPPTGVSYIQLSGADKGDDFWGTCVLVSVGRKLITATSRQGERAFTIDPSQGMLRYRILAR
jgi:hypothetical protein